MLKNEQSRSINHSITASTNVPPETPPSQPSTMYHQTTATMPQRSVDLSAIDITSMKGRFAWEKIPQSDTCMPAIFRGDTKYFCVRMLRKLLPEYPEDVIRRAPHYQYQYPIDLHYVTSHESDLLNRINSHHSRWAYARQAFTVIDELVRVVDFISFYEHLRYCFKSALQQQVTTTNGVRQPVPPPLQISQRPSTTMSSNTVPSSMYPQFTQPARASVQRQPAVHLSTPSLPNGSSAMRPIVPAPSIMRHPRPTASANTNSTAPTLPTYNTAQQIPESRPRPLLPPPQHIPLQQTTPTLPNREPHIPRAVPFNEVPIIASVHGAPTPAPPSAHTASSVSPSVRSLTDGSAAPPPPPQLSTSPTGPSPTTNNNRKLSTSSISSSSSTSITKPPRVYCGWVQINKLFSPYIATNTGIHSEYKIPVSLLLYYDLLKSATSDTCDSKDSVMPFEQIIATTQEIEVLNEFCAKHAVNAFANDTKLINLITFYQHCSANIIFVKELPLSEPKASICKDWLSVVQINGGICRLRNISTLQEQTVPYIGTHLLKNFILSAHCLARASLTKPTEAEFEFLQMILFFADLSINLRHAQLIDIESVRKEYNVDLILLFNDKFPLNVLNYQQQGNRPSAIQAAAIPPSSSAPTNTIAESTPPPSPPSPALSQAASNPAPQLALTSTTNRYQKTIEFHGHPMTAYICSGLGSNAQRECVSIRSLCNVLYPDSDSLEKLEAKMLRLLRSKNINRFRPQAQQSMGFTRLIDVQDAEKHWSFLERGIRVIMSNSKPLPSSSTASPMSTESPTASIPEGTSDVQQSSADVEKGEKRSIDEPLDEEDIPVMQRLNKRVRPAKEDQGERMIEPSVAPVLKNASIDVESTPSDMQVPQRRESGSEPSTKRLKKKNTPSCRPKKQSIAKWVTKYKIEACCIRLDPCDQMLNAGQD